MKNRYRIFISLFLLILFAYPTNIFSQRTKKRFPLQRIDFTITTNDGVILDCTKFIPDTVKPSAGWPAVIFCHGYGGSKNDYIPDAIEQSSYGYYSLCYSMRGQGHSTGFSNLISTTEMNDFIKVAQYVKAETIVNPNMVGAMGASQGGTIPLMACCNGLNLRCIVSDVSSPEFATSWIENNCVKMTLLWSLSYVDTIANYTPQVRAYRNWILADTPDKWDSLAYYVPMNRDFVNKINQNTTPFLAGMCWQDKFFNPYGFIKQVNNITTPYRMYFGTYDAHGADSAASECDYYDYISGEWADYWLQNEQNQSLDSAQFIYASSVYPRQNNKWTWQRFYSDTYRPAGTTDVKFYLQPNGRLYNELFYNNPSDTIAFVNDIKDTTLTMLEAVNREFNDSIFACKFAKTQLCFDTKPLLSDTRMIGTPMVNIHYLSSANKAQFNIQIWEIKSDGSGDIITRANYTERNIVPNVIRQLTFYGNSSSHIFKTGNKIRVIVTNLDNISNDPFLRTNPHVLPSLVKARNRIYMNTYNPTYVQLPLIGFIPISVNQISSNLPDKYKLEQNFPNPFNPSTTIKFGIANSENGKVKTENGFVILKIFDILGREIETLVNEKLQPGTYEVKFDGSKLASGIYFYKLISKDFVETKKMLMIK